MPLTNVATSIAFNLPHYILSLLSFCYKNNFLAYIFKNLLEEFLLASERE
jgi:hypothetical protein